MFPVLKRKFIHSTQNIVIILSIYDVHETWKLYPTHAAWRHAFKYFTSAGSSGGVFHVCACVHARIAKPFFFRESQGLQGFVTADGADT